jgi:hypothetical protein
MERGTEHNRPPRGLAHGSDVITEVIRPAAIVPENAARAILGEMSHRSVHNDGTWLAEPSCWTRYDLPWPAPGEPGRSHRLGTIQVAYGTPTKYEITIYQVTITQYGAATGMTVASLCDEALSFGELTLAQCPRATLAPPPKPFRF